MTTFDVRVNLIEEIRLFNRAATDSFLRSFSYEALVEYLDHLRLTTEPRNARSRWVRRGHRAAIMTRDPPDE
ncbi:MAG: hypothetical protein KAS72_14595 [Phycisphaerales bacterium]|nr:hypothetical protein [Phycisphaerales bacterium]